MNTRFRHSFRNRIFTTVLVVVLIMVLFCNVLIMRLHIYRNEQSLISQSQSQLNELNETLENTFSSYIDIAHQLQENIITQSALRHDGNDSRLLYQLLFEYTVHWREYARFDILNPNGDFLYTTNSTGSTDSLSTNWGILYAATQTNSMVFQSTTTESVDAEADGLTGLTCSYAIRTHANEILGYLVITMTLSDFEELFKGLYNTSGLLIFLDSYWHTIYASQTSQVEDKVSALRAQFLSGNPLSELDSDYHYFTSYNDTSGCYLMFLQPKTFTSSVMQIIHLITILMSLLCLPLCLLCTWFLSHHLSRPVKQLDDAMSEVMHGNFDIKIQIDSDDEFGRLGISFNKMVREYQKNLQRQQELNETKLRMLHAQLHPHFLYNTLDSIKWLGITHNVPTIATLSTSLASILRTSISAEELVPLQNELELMDNYVEIQSIRFQDSFTYETEIDTNCCDCLVPKLVLQPLIENSIIHGVVGLEEGYVKLSVHEEENNLILKVYDNGCGLPADILAWLKSENKPRLDNHMGLYNVHQIICLHYGEQYGLSYVPVETEGSCIQITLPIYRKEHDKIYV